MLYFQSQNKGYYKDNTQKSATLIYQRQQDLITFPIRFLKQ